LWSVVPGLAVRVSRGTCHHLEPGLAGPRNKPRCIANLVAYRPTTAWDVHRGLEHGDHIIERAASCLVLMPDPVSEIRGATDAPTRATRFEALPTLKLGTIRRRRRVRRPW
jgi:hypothetical protein